MTLSRSAVIVSVGDAPSGPWAPTPRVLEIVESRDAHHEELVEVRRVDRAELHALEQRRGRILGDLEDAVVEVQPRELAVEVELGSGEVHQASLICSLSGAGALGSGHITGAHPDFRVLVENTSDPNGFIREVRALPAGRGR